jgi:hypothetical protein
VNSAPSPVLVPQWQLLVAAIRAHVPRLIATTEILLHVTILIFAVIEILPHFVAEPALVYAVESNQIPGNVTVRTEFTNPNKNWPLYRLRAQWTLEIPDVALQVDAETPKYTIEIPSPESRILALSAPLPAERHFRAYLYSPRSFQIISYEFSAVVPRVRTNELFYLPVEVLSKADWNARTQQSLYTLVAGVAMLVAIMLLVHTLMGKLAGRLR